MKASLLSFLVCPKCCSSFNLQTERVEGSEIMQGELTCSGCGSSFPVLRGIPRFLGGGLNAEQKATAEAFSYEWTHFSQLTESDRNEFLAWIAPLTPGEFKGQVVLDAGCGKGRHMDLAARFGARAVVGVDLSDAVEAAFRNTRHLPNAHVVQADILNLPLQNPFTLVYSIGVIHHLPDPKAGFLALTRHVQPGGRISTWVYGKEGNGWIERFVDPVRKNITSRLPQPITRGLCFFPATLLYASLKLFYAPARRRPGLKRLLPYSEYLCSIAGYTFGENFWNVFDQLVAPTAYYHSRQEVVDWFRNAGVQNAMIERHNGNSWRGTGLIRRHDGNPQAGALRKIRKETSMACGPDSAVRESARLMRQLHTTSTASTVIDREGDEIPSLNVSLQEASDQ